MSLNAGIDVTIDDYEAVSTGSGLKLELYRAEEAVTTLQPFYFVGQTTAPFSAETPADEAWCARLNPSVASARVATLRGIAARANAYGAAIVAHLTANAKAVISTSTSCGRMSDPLLAGAPVQAPGSNVELSII
jgi:hypothetical protein